MKLLRQIDELLRGRYTDREALRDGHVQLPIRALVGAGVVLGLVYGLFMGLYGVLRPENPSVAQLAATTFKVPLLFLLTLVVTFPSLYVFSAIANSRLRFLDTLKLLLAGIVLNLAVLASFGPVTGFFTLSTESYPFMVVLNVIFFAIAGLVGLAFVWRALAVVFSTPPSREASTESDADDVVEETPVPEKEPERSTGASKAIFWMWTVIYGVVGAQMGWILRPFVGQPGLDFEIFRERRSNFFESILRTLGELLS